MRFSRPTSSGIRPALRGRRRQGILTEIIHIMLFSQIDPGFLGSTEFIILSQLISVVAFWKIFRRRATQAG